MVMVEKTAHCRAGDCD